MSVEWNFLYKTGCLCSLLKVWRRGTAYGDDRAIGFRCKNLSNVRGKICLVDLPPRLTDELNFRVQLLKAFPNPSPLSRVRTHNRHRQSSILHRASWKGSRPPALPAIMQFSFMSNT